MAIGQAGRITTNSPTENAPITVTLDEPLTDPVFALTGTNNGGNQFVLRVIDTTENADGDVVSFDFIIEEWEYHDGAHPATETIHWLAVEAGVHTLPDGRVIEAGTIETNAGSGNTAVPLTGGFANPPVVLTSVMSNNDTTTVDSDPLNITASGFNIQMQEEEAEDDNHAPETVGFIAIQPGAGEDSGTAATFGAFDHNVDTYTLGDDFATPVVLGETQTIAGGNPATVVIDSLDSGADTVDLFLEEEASQDSELNHIDEVLGLVAFEEGLILCFAAGTRIDTADGPVRVEDLDPGALLCTMDHGLQPLRWKSETRLSALDLAREPALAPVRFAPGSLGGGLPDRPLMVSAQHRMLITGWRAELFFGTDQLLVPAKALVNGTSVTRSIPEGGVRYFHLLMDAHELLLGHGVYSESLHPAQVGQAKVMGPALAELRRLFPNLCALRAGHGPLARPTLSVREGSLLAA